MIVEELSCRELVELVTEYIEQAMPEAERARFEAHLTACPGCRAYLDQMRRTIHLLSRPTEESIPPAIRDEMLRVFRDWRRGQ